MADNFRSVNPYTSSPQMFQMPQQQPAAPVPQQQPQPQAMNPQQFYDPQEIMASLAQMNPLANASKQAQTNVMRNMHNLGDSATTPRNKTVRDEGKQQPLFNALTDFAGGSMSAADFQSTMRKIMDSGTQSRRSLDVKQRGNLGAINSFANMLANADQGDIDGLTEANTFNKQLMDATKQFGMPNSSMQDAQEQAYGQQKQYLNSKGIQEFGPGAYKPSNDNWKQIAQQRDAERKQFMSQITDNAQQGLMAHLMATVNQNQMNATNSAMQLAQSGQQLTANRAHNAALPAQLQAELDAAQAAANPANNDFKMLDSAAKMAKDNPDAIKNVNFGPIFARHGATINQDEPASGANWLQQLFDGGKKPEANSVNGTPPPSKQFPGAVPIPAPAKPGTMANEDVMKQAFMAHKGNKAAMLAALKKAGWKV